MPLTVVLGPGRASSLSGAEFEGRRAAYEATVVDVGTGDGRFAYHLAGLRPDALVVGLDPVEDNMADVARRATRKPVKGGRANVLLVRAAIEDLPPELAGVAREVYVHLPWGRLLEGIVQADDEVLRGLVALCEPGARLFLTLNAEIWIENMPARFRDLPAPTPEFVADVVAPRFAAAGIALGPARVLEPTEVAALTTTWAKRLRHGGREPHVLAVEGTADP